MAEISSESDILIGNDTGRYILQVAGWNDLFIRVDVEETPV